MIATKFESIKTEYLNIWSHIECILAAKNVEIILEFFSEKNVIQIQKISVNFKRQKDDTTLV